jgi:hypothetical protein
MEEFVSEPIRPEGGTFDTTAMAAGLPGLPQAFRWRGREYAIQAQIAVWKASGPEIGRSDGERYLRRHYFRLRMNDGTLWTVYFTRHTPPSGSPKRRWFLYSIERAQ